MCIIFCIPATKKPRRVAGLISFRFQDSRLVAADILLGYCSTACVTVCSVSPGIVGAIGCGIAVLSDAFGCTSAPFAARKDGRMFRIQPSGFRCLNLESCPMGAREWGA